MAEDPTSLNDSARAALGGSSPYATGGGGVTFERRVAATYLARLLAGLSSLEIGGGRIVERVAFQQGPGRAVDDIVVTAANDGGGVQVSVACRRRPEFVTSDDDTRKLVGALLRALPAPSEGPEQRLLIAVAGAQANATQVQELADLARFHDDHCAFYDALAIPRRFRQELRNRLGHVETLVSVAFADQNVKPVWLLADGVADNRFLTWLVLRNLWILSPRLESPDETDWAHIADLLAPISRTQDAVGGISLLEALESLAASYSPAGASVDLTMLRRAVHNLLHRPAFRTSAPRAQLSHLGDMLAATTGGAIGANDEEPLHLDRQPEREALRATLTGTAGAVLVTGQSGAGKSRLVLDVLAALTTDADHVEFMALSLRDLPPTSVELRAALAGDARDALATLSAPSRFLVIDAAEAALDGRRELLTYLATAARDADVRLVVVSTTEGASVVGAVLEDLGIGAGEQAVGVLTDDEVDAIADRFPWVSPLATNSASRDLLRRPVVADLLVRARAGSHVVSEAAAMGAVWKGLVRNDGRPSAGLSTDREQVVRALASAELAGATVDELKLDAAAVAGLRTDGVLQARDIHLWEHKPAFAHDQLRTYAVAALLAGSKDLVDALAGAGAPRWALPAARIAAQVRLEASASPAETFHRLQAGFDDVAEEHGGRWGDVPTEALLASSDPRPALTALWPQLVAGDAEGLDRILRLVGQRHRDGVFLRDDAFGPVLELLFEHGTPNGIGETAAELTDDWLRSLLFRAEPAGHPLRTRLRQQVFDVIDEGARRREQLRAEEDERLARRTPEQVQEDERRAEELRRRLPPIFPSRRRTRRLHDLPEEVTNEWTIRRLSLLGPDAGVEGGDLLSQVAEHSPHSLDAAVETMGAPLGLIQLDRKLLTTLTEAYYIEDEDEDESGYGGGFMDEGIRDHDPRNWGFGLPMAAYYRGPFVWLFRSDLVGGVRVLNRILNHAARHRERYFFQHGWIEEGEHRHELRVTGEPKVYLGDGHVYQWHAGTGVGPHPCTSGLQALEFVANEALEKGVSLEAIVRMFLLECENVAMIALVVRFLAQRFDVAGTLLDPFLKEPALWHFEFSRAIAEVTGMRIRSHGQTDDTRSWNLRDLAMQLGIAAWKDKDRADQLRKVGGELVAATETYYRERRLSGAELANRTAVARAWAAALDTDRYHWAQLADGTIAVEAVPPGDVTETLSHGDKEVARSRRALLVSYRYINRRDRTGRVATDVPVEEILDDVAFARSIESSAPRLADVPVDDGSAAVAASVVATQAERPGAIPDDNVVWAIHTLLAAAGAAVDDGQYFGQGADRSAALGLPILLTTQPVPGAPSIEDVEAAVLGLARRGSVETRAYLAVALSRVFGEPCSPSRCVHIFARDVLIESARRCAVGPWNQDTQRRDLRVLEGPIDQALESVEVDELIPECLSPAIRGLTDAAVHQTCIAPEARHLTASLLTHHARSVAAREHPAHHSSADALIAARAVLTFALHGSQEAVVGLLWAHASNERSLGEILHALGAAAEESEALAGTLRSVWPLVIDVVLAFVDAGVLRPGRRYFDGEAISDLIPYGTAPDFGYLRRELEGDRVSWTDLVGWSAAIDRWVPYAAGRASCVDRLIWLATATLSAEEQTRVVLPWVEAIARDDTETVVSQSDSLASWLRDLRAVVTGTGEQAMWQSLVDGVVMFGGPAAADLAD